MEFANYIDAQREFQNKFLLYIDEENNDESSFSNIVNLIKEQNLHENDEELKIFYYFLCNIVNNHYRSANFFDKIERSIFQLFSDDIKNIFSNTEIYHHL